MHHSAVKQGNFGGLDVSEIRYSIPKLLVTLIPGSAPLGPMYQFLYI